MTACRASIQCTQCKKPIDMTGRRRGVQPKYCSKECKAATRRANYASNEAKPCSIDGCEKNRNQARAVCNTHAMRSHRYGDPSIDKTRTGTAWKHSHGYIIIGIPGHPLAQHDGGVYQHRKVLWDAIGSGQHKCQWCHKTVEWMTSLEVDHIDGVKTNNAIENLVPACHGCNTRRAMHNIYHQGHNCSCPLADVFDASIELTQNRV